jgi:hypothetical protein
MNSEAVVIVLWTSVVLLLIWPGVAHGIFLLFVLVPTFSILCSYSFPLFDRWPFLRPSSAPMIIVGAALFIAVAAYRYERHRRSTNDPKA